MKPDPTAHAVRRRAAAIPDPRAREAAVRLAWLAAAVLLALACALWRACRGRRR